jgi:hypothetical protein
MKRAFVVVGTFRILFPRGVWVRAEAMNVCQNPTEAVSMNIDLNRQQIAREAKAIVALAMRNGPIEEIHAGQLCPTCAGQSGFSRITDDEIKLITKNAVDHVYALLVLKAEQPAQYEAKILFGQRYTAKWDEPEIPVGRSRRSLSDTSS